MLDRTGRSQEGAQRREAGPREREFTSRDRTIASAAPPREASPVREAREAPARAACPYAGGTVSGHTARRQEGAQRREAGRGAGLRPARATRRSGKRERRRPAAKCPLGFLTRREAGRGAGLRPARATRRSGKRERRRADSNRCTGLCRPIQPDSRCSCLRLGAAKCLLIAALLLAPSGAEKHAAAASSYAHGTRSQVFASST